MAEDADRAAGEVIFSSDGLPPVAVVPPTLPEITTTTDDDNNNNNDDMTVLDTGNSISTPGQAFEVFSGKLYPVTTNNNNYNNNNAGSVRAKMGLLSETPAQRLARLQQEVGEMEQDLTSASAAPSKEEAGERGEVSDSFLKMLSDLKSRIQTQAGVVASAKNQEEMTLSIQQHLKTWNEHKKGSSKGGGGDDDKTAEAGVVYELYGGVGVPNASSVPSYEERLLQVERLLGSTTSQNNNQTSLLARLEEMETQLSTLDPKALEQASAKAKVIRSDLEAASKARNKLASAATFRKEDAKTISDLWDQMTQLEGLSGHLPALVARLQQLASLHAQSSSFAVRLTQSEKEVTQLQTLLKELDASVSKVETGMVENVKVIEKNMQELDERMKKL